MSRPRSSSSHPRASPARSDSEPGETPPTRGSKRQRTGLLTVNGEHLTYCVPKSQPPWFMNMCPWMQQVSGRLPTGPRALGKELHGTNSFKPLHEFLAALWPDYVAAGKMRAPAKPRTKGAAKSTASRGDGKEEEEQEEDEAAETKVRSGAAETKVRSEADEPAAAKKPRKPRNRVPKERLQSMKDEAESKLNFLVSKMTDDAQGMEAVEKLAEIVQNALRSVEDLSEEGSPDSG